MQISLKFIDEYLRNNKVESFSEYSPVQISRLVFDKQLDEIKQ